MTHGLHFNAKDLEGKEFYRLRVLSLAPKRGRGLWWNCICACGKELVVRASALTSQTQKSCGCLSRDKTSARSRVHGESNANDTPEHRAWHSAISRCHNPNSQSFHSYGARGISVCDKWRNSYTAFLADMGRRPTSAHSLERVNNDGGYSPENCRWATPAEQSRNQRRNIRILVNGELVLLKDACRARGINSKTGYWRHSQGWAPDEILSTTHECRGRK